MADLAIILVLVALGALALRSCLRGRKNGGCSGGCGSCSGRCHKHNRQS